MSVTDPRTAPRNVRSLTASQKKRALFVFQQLVDQKRWIAEHGGDRAGYIARYGSMHAADHHGDGGEPIYEADAAALARWQTAYNQLPTHWRTFAETALVPGEGGHDRLPTPAKRVALLAQWVDFCRYADLFAHGYAGYWCQQLACHPVHGHLVVEDDMTGNRDVHASQMTAWTDGVPYATDRPSRARVWGPRQWEAAYRYGERLWGEAWYEDPMTDAGRYDVVMQLALLGEVRYG